MVTELTSFFTHQGVEAEERKIYQRIKGHAQSRAKIYHIA